MNLPSLARQLSAIPALDEGRSIALYGAGAVGRDVLALLTQMGIRVKYFLDRKQLSSSHIEGIPVFKPDAPELSKEERQTTPVIVSIFNAYVSVPAIHSMLAEFGWQKVTGFLEFYERFSDRLGDRFWLTGLSYYEGKQSHYGEAADVWADQKSRDLYESILRFRFSGDYGFLPHPDEHKQYFADDVPRWGSPLRMIDCGAFDGDTLRQVRDLELPVEAVAAFEPDSSNYPKLAIEAQRFQGIVQGGISAWPCGVWNRACQLRFEAGHGSGSAISSAGQTVIQCVSIDEALNGFRPNLIKMDIEGAEYSALLGAKETIHRHLPGLAVCLYHTPSHLWQIPLLVADWNLGYKFYLRCHCFSGFELVMYALPTS